MATMATQTVELTALARQMDESVAVAADWATADQASVAAFEAWEQAYRIDRAQFDAAVAGEGVREWQSLPEVVERANPYGGTYCVRVCAVSECGGGSEAVYWWEIADGRFLGYSTTGGIYWQIPAGTQMPVITGYAETSDDSDEA